MRLHSGKILKLPDQYFKNIIRDIPDFPSSGITFRDITPIFTNPSAFSKVVDWYCEQITKFAPIKKIVAIESRGFIFGSAVAYKMNLGLVPIRKKGKLPHKKVAVEYKLEYGVDTVEIHTDSLQPGEEVVILDDLIATGGTANAAIDLVTKIHGVPKVSIFFAELVALGGRNKLKTVKSDQIISLIKY